MENPLRHPKGHISKQKESYLVRENLLRHTTDSKDWMINNDLDKSYSN